MRGAVSFQKKYLNHFCYKPAFIIVVSWLGTAVKVTQGVVHSLRFIPKQELLIISIATRHTQKIKSLYKFISNSFQYLSEWLAVLLHFIVHI